MSIQAILPLPDLSNLLLAMLILLVAVRSRGIIDIIPVLRRGRLLLILPSFLARAALTSIGSVEAIDVVVVARPIRNARLDQRLRRMDT